MQKMLPEYAQKILDGQYVFGNRFFSCHNDLLVVTFDGNEWPYLESYQGTQLNDGQFMLDSEGYVVFFSVQPIIDENTRFTA